MAQVISTLCDECLDAGEETPGDTYGLSLEVPGAKPAPYLIDACEVHAKPYRDLLEVLEHYGRRGDRKVPLPRTVTATPAPSRVKPAGVATCPVDGCKYVPPTRDALRSHLKTHHGTTLTQVGLSRSSVPADGKPVVCPEPGCGREFVKPQGLARHRTTIHAADRAQVRE